MNWELGILLFVTLIISLTCHEAAHALFAKLGGDLTAYHAGQVTLNPIPHMQRAPFGMVVLPILSIYLSIAAGNPMALGFAHAPIDPIWAYHNPKKAALMSAAGPLANLLLAAIAFAVLYFIARPDGDAMVAIRKIAGVFLLLNLLLCIFNLVPLPPLDGAGVVGGLFRPAQRLFDGIMRIPYSFVIVMIVLWNMLPYLFWPVFNTVNGWLPYAFRF